MSIAEALSRACAQVGLKPPIRLPVPGRWVRTDTLGKNGKGDGAVLIFDDQRGGMVWNHKTAQRQRFALVAEGHIERDPQAERRARERDKERETERRIVAGVCETIVRGCRQDRHPYLAAKGFPDERGLVCDDPRAYLPDGRLGEMIAHALPEGDGPLLIIPGRIDGRITTLQFITSAGSKKNILRGVMAGAAHRIATGRDTWVCEGIGTALTIRAALRLLGLSSTVISAFSASNVGQVAAGISGARIATDNDKPIETLDGLGAGAFYARRSGRLWTMPLGLEDFNDWHQREGLRAVALHLKEAMA